MQDKYVLDKRFETFCENYMREKAISQAFKFKRLPVGKTIPKVPKAFERAISSVIREEPRIEILQLVHMDDML